MQLKSNRKRRTRQHIIADQSVNHVERFIIDEGHTAQRLMSDYGYDVAMMTFDEEGYAEPGLVFLQLKATDLLEKIKENYIYDIDIRDYNLWKDESLPVILVLFDAEKRRAYWVHLQSYFDDSSRRPRKGSKTVRVRISQHQILNRRSVAKMRAIKRPTTLRLTEGTTHA